ncbi:MAG: ABC transporter substrate-binding protein [Nitrospirota bacterium]
MLKNRLTFMLLLAVIAAALNLDIFLAKASSAATLTQQERRGKQIYLKGISFSERPIKAFVGDASMEVPGNTFPCANCHGYDGQGRSEGGVIPSNITWEYLTKSYDIIHPGGRKHPAYAEGSIKRAITEGIDPAGNRLAVAMPRYLMSQEDIADLVSYLRRLGKDLDPGLTETSIRIGTILPLSGSLAEMGMEMKGVMTAYFEDINNQGGIYGRKVELQVSGISENVSGAIADARRLVRDGGVFAIVGSFTAGADKEIANIAYE